jgi:hypothetical protein
VCSSDLGYAEHFKEVSEDHIERVVTIRDPNLDHQDVSFYFIQRSSITGRIQKVRGNVIKVVLNKRIETRLLLPTPVFLRRVVNTLEPQGDVTVYTTYLYYIFLAKLFKSSAHKVTMHVLEEMENTKKALEH